MGMTPSARSWNLCDLAALDPPIERAHEIRRHGDGWTQEEHSQFLIGMNRFGYGKWRAISQNHVPSKSPAQVAAYARRQILRAKILRLAKYALLPIFVAAILPLAFKFFA
ncbi:hypothetical protein Tsubulata_038501 [Turnera subulata]|uniref:Myb-like domain-containing protein n=1 Tax=Turnera subulata TaxID=218843 RepID=A0A9Q0FNU3_9ROSI|nr:hypothetical protein Tsubulata_038501 [Turnera subulata]